MGTSHLSMHARASGGRSSSFHAAGAALLACLVMGTGLVSAGRVAAQAETCVMLPDEGQAPDTVRQQVADSVAQELRDHGWVVLSSRDAQMRMIGQPQQECHEIDCAPEVNRFLGTGVAVLTEITWVGGRATMVNVALIGLTGDHSVGGQAEVPRGGDVQAAAREAFRTALDRWEADSQGHLVIDSVPSAAFIELDGQSLGRAPLRRLVRAGVHTVRATLEGYASQTREITIDRHEERTLTFDLVAGESGSSSSSSSSGDERGEGSGEVEDAIAMPVRTRSEGHWANWAIGGGLVAAGLVALIPPIWTLSTTGEVDSAGPRDSYVDVGPQTGVLLAVGGTAIVAGALVMILAPIRVEVSETARVSLTPTLGGLSVSGAF